MVQRNEIRKYRNVRKIQKAVIIVQNVYSNVIGYERANKTKRKAEQNLPGLPANKAYEITS